VFIVYYLIIPIHRPQMLISYGHDLVDYPRPHTLTHRTMHAHSHDIMKKRSGGVESVTDQVCVCVCVTEYSPYRTSAHSAHTHDSTLAV
jgi:hypothetical protein